MDCLNQLVEAESLYLLIRWQVEDIIITYLHSDNSVRYKQQIQNNIINGTLNSYKLFMFGITFKKTIYNRSTKTLSAITVFLLIQVT